MVSFYNFSCLYHSLSSRCKNCGKKTLNLPLIGEISVLSFVVLLCCITFAAVWALNRRSSYSWAGQNILVSILFAFFCSSN